MTLRFYLVTEMTIILSIVLNENWKLLVIGSEPTNSHLMLIKVCSSCLTEKASEVSINSKLGDSLINRVSSTKFLGTWVDDQLNWKTHMSRLLSKLKCGLGMLQRSSDLLSPKAKKLLYYSQVHSHLCYGLGVWGPMLSVGQTKELCTLQRKCVRLIDRKLPISEAFKRLQILRVMDLIELEQAKLGYKLCNRLLPTVLIRLMMHDYDNSTMVKSHSYQTRQKNIPNRPNTKLNLYRKSFLYQAIAATVN